MGVFEHDTHFGSCRRLKAHLVEFTSCRRLRGFRLTINWPPAAVNESFNPIRLRSADAASVVVKSQFDSRKGLRRVEVELHPIDLVRRLVSGPAIARFWIEIDDAVVRFLDAVEARCKGRRRLRTPCEVSRWNQCGRNRPLRVAPQFDLCESCRRASSMD